MTLLYAFNYSYSSTFRLLKELHLVKIFKLYIKDDASGIDALISHLNHNSYENIIGLGDYRKDSKKIRIETKFINRYGKNKIDESNISDYDASLKLNIANEDVYISNKPSCGPCNRSAFNIAKYIKRNNLICSIDFIHIPRSFNIQNTSKIISRIIN